MNVAIKGIPVPVYRSLKRDAQREGRSFNIQVIHVLRTHVEDAQKFKRMRESQDELERFVASLPPMSDSTPLIREDRMR